MREPWKSPSEKKAFIYVFTNDFQVAMKGKYGLIAGLMSLFLLLGVYGCDRKEKGAEAAPPRPAYHVVETGENEYRVQSFSDPPPKVSIETEPWGDSTGTEARIRVYVVDSKVGNSGISEVQVYDDCDLIGDYKPDDKIRKFSDIIPVKHYEEGERSFYVIATDVEGQKSEAYKNLYFSGEVDDQPPRIQRFDFSENGFDIGIYDPGENSGIAEVILLEGDKPLYIWENPTFSGTGVPIPDGREGTHEYSVQVKDIGDHVVESEKITVNYGTSDPLN